MSEPPAAKERSFFISRAASDKEAALVVDEILRAAGFSTYIQDKDFGNTPFSQRNDDGKRMVDEGARIVAILTADYLASASCLAEAHHFLTDDPTNEQRRLILLRVEDCTPLGPLQAIPYTDLMPLLDDADAFARVVRGAAAPDRNLGEARFAGLHRRSGRQILHADVRPVPEFAGRASELIAIDAALWSKGGTAAVHGIAGVGKSVIARQYAWDNRERYAGVWWVDATTRDSILGDLMALGARLVPGLDEMPDRTRASLLTLDTIAQVQGSKPWLIVYDNVETSDVMGNLTPAAGAHALITSRSVDWNGRAVAVPVGTFPRPLAMDYLLTRAHKRDAAAAGRLADDLGGLPLAIAHARATALAMGLDFDAYRTKLADLIARAPKGAASPAPVFATTGLALQHAIAKCPAAESLLSVAAYLAPERIPLDIVPADLIPTSERASAVTALTEVALAEPRHLEDGNPGFGLHPLVQTLMQERLGQAGGAQAALALKLVAAAFPDTENEAADNGTWDSWKRLQQHARAVLSVAPDAGDGAAMTSLLLHHLSQFLQAHADYEEAEPLIRRALAINEKAFGAEDAKVAANLSSLGSLLRESNRLEDAEPVLRRALAAHEAARGAEHPAVGTALNDLASVLRDLGRSADAEPLLRRSLKIAESTGGKVASQAKRLASILQTNGRHDEAEKLLRRSLELDEKEYGASHPEIADDLGKLAALLIDRDRLAEAEPLLRRALTIGEAELEPQHPGIAIILGKLASVLENTGRRAEALPLARRALDIDAAAYDPEHPIVAMRYNNLATLLADLGRPAEADAYVRHALVTAERSLGSDHPNTRTYRANYERIIAAMDAMARQDDLVEKGKAPAPPDRLARPDILPPGAKRSLLQRMMTNQR